ncbi:MAG: DUF192 domain-containing protein [Emcibacter sp.]|nr:DUF192 domain-containing protein [Emcibacter sp.]
MGKILPLKHRYRIGFFLILHMLCTGMVFCHVSFATEKLAIENSEIFEHSQLAIASGGREYRFNVEVAKSYSARAQGLMFRREMPQTSGMLFLFEGSQDVAMWMKNTYISLDIIFMDSNGVIVYIAKSTTPESLDIISPQKLVSSVLELNAGITDLKNIKIGDKIIYPVFQK